MQEVKFSFLELRHAISDERFYTYRNYRQEPDADILSRYLWNIALSESLYSSLNVFEIVLRNNIHQAFCITLDPRWLHKERYYLRGHERSALEKTKMVLGTQSNISDNQIISHLTLGFWSGLFKNMYDTGLYKDKFDKRTKYDERIKIWRRVLKPSERKKNGIFPNARKSDLKIPNLGPRVNKIRTLRNQIFHHEPILHLSDLQTRHTEILEMINWISPSVHLAV